MYVGGSGWIEGLPIVTEDWADEGQGMQRKRWTWTNWTQDNPSLPYIQNPRVIETKVGDEANIRRTTIDYYTQQDNPSASLFGLVREVTIYDSSQTSILKRYLTEYNLSQEYVSRRIIGLVQKQELYDGQGALMSKVTYGYDEEDFSDSSLEQNISPIQHDNVRYGANFIVGRGNQTSVTRWDVLGETANVTSRVKYNTAGAVVAQIDPMNRVTKISYRDSFSDGQDRNTFAYPTKLTDAAGNFSEIKYRYDIGANVWAKSPAPAGNVQGKITERIYDNLGRLERERIVNTGAYTRYEYGLNGIQMKIYSTLVDVNNNGVGDEADEVMTEIWTDGAGRTRMSRVEHPGSVGGWSAERIEYDIMGRVKRRSVPTEVDSNWNPAGDDVNRGWLWMQFEYDWKGRVTREINTDGTDRLITYTGCGCAGGEVVTVQGEEIIETDWTGNPIQTLGRRKRKIYSDILGRTWKTEIFNWDGSIYSTIVNTFNGRDQVIRIRHYAGDESSSTFQETTFTYDGHGRLKGQHLPEQAINRGTSYEYFPDDRIKKITDARGATTSYEYETRGLIERITYNVPTENEFLTPWIYRVDRLGNNGLLILGNNFATNVEVVASNFYTGQELARYSGGQLTRGMQEDRQTISFQITQQEVLNALEQHSLGIQVVNSDTGQQSGRLPLTIINSQTVGQAFGRPETIAPAASVSYQYDAVGNRVSMTDELGSVSYSYDQLSRLTSETRQIAAIGRSFTITYTYGLSGQVKSITDPFNAIVSYNYDKTSRLTTVSGVGYDVSAPFVSNIQYRAWGAVKKADYGYGGQMNITYDIRLRPTRYAVTGTTYGNSYIRGSNYDYYADGQLKLADDLADDRFDKFYKYDQVGRLKEALSGIEARGENVPPGTYLNRPYRQSYVYDVWGNRIGGEQWFWSMNLSWQFQNTTYINNRSNKSTYDADGRELTRQYDAAGRAIEYISQDTVGGYPTDLPLQPLFEIRQRYDGDDQIGRREEVRRREVTGGGQTTIETTTTVTYYIRSSVLGGETVVEVNEQGEKKEGDVYAARALLVQHYPNRFCQNCSQNTLWQEVNPLTGSRYEVDGQGYTYPDERDPMGVSVGQSDPGLTLNYLDLVTPYQDLFLDSGGNPFNSDNNCVLDGLPINCNELRDKVDSGMVEVEISHGARRLRSEIFPFGLGLFEMPSAVREDPEQEGQFLLTRPNIFSFPTPRFAIHPWSQQSQQQSENMKAFNEAVEAVKEILSQNGGNNRCANFFGGAGLEALAQIVALVNSQGESETFEDLGNETTGIKMEVPRQVNPDEIGIPLISTLTVNLKGKTREIRTYVAASLSKESGDRIRINTSGPFLNKRAARIGGYAAASLKSRILQLLHEIGHIVITNRLPGITIRSVSGEERIYQQLALVPLLPYDGDNVALSEKNTKKVKKNCRAQIKALLKKRN